jgi:transcription initiation factor TFIIA large subunit
MATYNDATFSATTFSGKPLDIDTLPDHIKLLIKDVRAKRIGQLDGGDDDVR